MANTTDNSTSNATENKGFAMPYNMWNNTQNITNQTIVNGTEAYAMFLENLVLSVDHDIYHFGKCVKD